MPGLVAGRPESSLYFRSFGSASDLSIDPQGGEGIKLTSGDGGAGSFKWSPDGKFIAYTATDSQTDAMKNREKKYGQFDAIDQDYRMTHLYVVDVMTKNSRRLTQGSFTVGSFDWSLDGKKIVFDHRINPALSNSDTSNISVLDVDNPEVRLLVSQAGPDRNPLSRGSISICLGLQVSSKISQMTRA